MKVYRDEEKKAFINETASTQDKLIVIGVPYKLIPIEKVFSAIEKKEVPEVELKGTIEFYLGIKWEDKDEQTKVP